ncbi:MAG: hypothetical protein Q4P15_00220 [Propionibacteriaceae bacterium]|nr:hypothetical protein [Propionibacteriaceae bacterium]
MTHRLAAVGALALLLLVGCSPGGPAEGPATTIESQDTTPSVPTASGTPTISGNFPTWSPSPATVSRDPEQMAQQYADLFADARIAAEEALGSPTQWWGLESVVYVERTFVDHDGDGICIVALRDSSKEGLDVAAVDMDLFLSVFNVALARHGFPAASELVTNPGGEPVVVSDMPGGGPRFTAAKGWLMDLELRIPAAPSQCTLTPGSLQPAP